MKYNLALKKKKKKGNSAICDNVDECREHHSKGNKPDTGQNTTCYHLHEESIIIKRREADSGMVVARSWWRRNGTHQKVQSFSYAK